MSGGLTRRMVVASGLLALVVGAAFAVLLVSVTDLRTSERLARRSQEVLAAATQLERLILDLETGVRGFVITGQERFLQPWQTAQITFPEQARTLQRLVAGNPDQQARAKRIMQAATAYVGDYSMPLVNVVRRDPAAAQMVAATQEGKRRVDAIRVEFDRLMAAERGLVATRQARSDTAERRAVAAAAGGLAGSVLLVLLFAGYLTQAIVRPVRRAAAMAGRLARGDLGARMPQRGVGEIGALEGSFNSMAGALQASRDELGRLLEEQAALRRVATLVARGVPPAAVFAAVAEEAGRLLGADDAAVARFEPDGVATVVVALGEDVEGTPAGTRWELDDSLAITAVWRTGRAARVDRDCGRSASGATAEDLRRADSCSAAASPILVEGRLWGAMCVSTKRAPLPADTEARMANFTELVATAIANAESRAELAASRARIVRSADETRRRIERDLHDGIQQRLVSLGLDLRATQTAVPAELPDLGTQLAQIADGLSDALAELQELSRGIHPAILSEGGLGPTLRMLARRAAVPVELDVVLQARLPAPVEVAAYYAVSEALANAAKHAHASLVRVELAAGDGRLHLLVADDGVGGADPSRGSGLVGLSDRVQALGGTITVRSPAGEGSTLQINLPIDLNGARPRSGP